MRTFLSISDQKISLSLCRFLTAGRRAKLRFSRQGEAGITLVETMVSLMVLLIGLAGLFGTSARSFTLLRRSKETVAVRESILTRLDGIRALSFTEVARATPPSGSATNTGSLSTNLLKADASGDPTPFTVTLGGLKNFKETVNVYALGAQLFSNDAQRNAATPDYKDEYASQVDTKPPDDTPTAPAPPTTYKASSTAQGAWVAQVANALPYYTITRTGTGATSSVTVDNGTSTNGDLSAYPQLRVDVIFTWTDSNNITRSQMGCTLVSRNGSLQ